MFLLVLQYELGVISEKVVGGGSAYQERQEIVIARFSVSCCDSLTLGRHTLTDVSLHFNLLCAMALRIIATSFGWR